MKIDYELLWDARPISIPGEIVRILPNSRGFIRLKIPLRYLDGKILDEVTSGQLFNFSERDSVLFTIRTESPLQRQSRENNNKKLEADNVRAVTDSKIEEAVNSFQGEALKLALEQAAQAEQNATEAERKAQEKEVEYNKELAALELRQAELDEEIARKVAEWVVPEREKLDQDRSNLVSSQQETDKRQEEL